MAVVDVDEPISPFGATVTGVTDLVPETRLRNEEDEPVVGEAARITATAVVGWINEISGAVAMRLDGWQRLPDEPVEPEQDSDRDQLVSFARTVVENGAASYLEAARHPERANVNETSYAAVLWARYQSGLDTLAGWLAARLASSATDPGTGATGGVLMNFPSPLFGDCLQF